MTSTEISSDGRTLMATVLFADLVGYSKKAISDQIAAKESFRILLQSVLSDLSPGNRVVVDTGDGAAVAFLADPEHALYFAMRLRREVDEGEARGLLREDLRIGINLGPVRRAIDVNGRPNLVGEGMNSAERIMSFSSPGETTVSRSFRDAVGCLDTSYRDLFEAVGTRADKHGRPHEVFRIRASALALQAAATSLAQPTPSSTGSEQSAAVRSSAARARPARRARHGLLLAGAVACAAIGGMFLVQSGTEMPMEAGPQPSRATPTAAPEPPAVAPAAQEEKAEAAAQPADVPAQATVEEERPSAVRSRPEPMKAGKAQRSMPSAPSPRCDALLQRATLGERLNAREQEELRICR